VSYVLSLLSTVMCVSSVSFCHVACNSHNVSALHTSTVKYCDRRCCHRVVIVVLRLSCILTNDFHHIGHEKLIFCFSGTFMKKRMRKGEKYYCIIFSCVPVDSNVKHCVILYTLPLMTKIFSRTPR